MRENILENLEKKKQLIITVLTVERHHCEGEIPFSIRLSHGNTYYNVEVIVVDQRSILSNYFIAMTTKSYIEGISRNLRIIVFAQHRRG
jgi:hypothetical protein